jgi:hypothetical protein
MFYLYLILGIIGSLVVLTGLFGLIMHFVGKGMNPDHELACTMRLNQSPLAVYDAISDAASWPSWDPGVRKVEILPSENGQPACRMFIGNNAMRLVTTRAEPPFILERTVRDEGKRLVFSGSWRHQITPAGDGASTGCTITLTERGTIHIPIARAMARKLADPAMYLKRHLKRLAAKFGEEAKIE